jgi:hypothetical protein
MKLKREDIKKTVRSIKASPFREIVNGRGTVFVPFEVEENIEEKGNGIVLMETKKEGSRTFVKPGLLIRRGKDGEEVSVTVAYVSTEYAAPFNFKMFIKYVGKQDSPRRAINNLSSLDYLLVREDYILTEFKLNLKDSKDEDLKD